MAATMPTGVPAGALPPPPPTSFPTPTKEDVQITPAAERADSTGQRNAKRARKEKAPAATRAASTEDNSTPSTTAKPRRSAAKASPTRPATASPSTEEPTGETGTTDDKPETGGVSSMVVAKAVKGFLKNYPTPMNVGGDVIRALNAKVADDLVLAANRALGNGRKTIRAVDL